VPIVEIPDPCLVVLIGAAGAGKTTFAARHFQPAEILSSDGYRAMIGANEGDQSVTRAAFGRLHRDLTRRLGSGLLTVVDATNLESHARQALLQRARAAGVAAVAIVLDLPAAVVQAQNVARAGRVVDGAVVQRHLARLRGAIDGPGGALLTEGFASITVFRDPVELAHVSLIRRPR
jgi:protein phosphatase